MNIYYGIYINKSFQLIKTIEKKYNAKLIYVKDVNTRHIDKILMLIYKNYIVSINDNNSLRHILQKNSNQKILLIIKSIGGYISSSDSMLNLLSSHNCNKIAYIPSYAMSAACLLALACDKIYMNKYAAIGPTDPQITVLDETISFRVIQTLIENKSINNIDDKVLINYYDSKILNDENINSITKYVNKHKKKNISNDQVNELINKFSYGNIPHHTEITPNYLTKFLNINNDIPNDILCVYKLINYIFEMY